ncbi:MAG: hypothetical protein ACR2I2_02045 [Bryobacteraceae bacterium]
MDDQDLQASDSAPVLAFPQILDFLRDIFEIQTAEIARAQPLGDRLGPSAEIGIVYSTAVVMGIASVFNFKARRGLTAFPIKV